MMKIFTKNSLLVSLLMFFLIGCGQNDPGDQSVRERVNFSGDWQFIKEDAANPEELNLKDPNWRTLDLPHDWAIEGPFTEEVSYKGGYLPYPGTGWYLKKFTVPQNTDQLRIEFDGVMRNSEIWLNGKHIGGWPYGYTSFAIDISDLIDKEGENTLLVRAQNQDHSSRWYPGSGIYRKVWLNYTNAISVAHWGTYVTTPEISEEKATVSVETTLQNRSGSSAEVELTTTIMDADGKMVASKSQSLVCKSDAQSVAVTDLKVDSPRLWDIESPNLYTVVSEVSFNGERIDRYETPFGIRTFSFDPDQGFFLNGNHVKLKGVNMHHGLGPLGAAVNKRATERQLEIMKEMGINAIRTAHNPPSIEQLDLCDQMGILVIDETFDTWNEPKGGVENDYSIWFEEWYLKDTEALIRRDRNHPSVILWSIGNEVMNMDTPEGKKYAKDQAALCKKLDPTRPVTAGVHLTIEFDEELEAVFDVFGMNYWQDRYDQLHAQFPNLPLLASESAATLSTRGEYHFPVEEVYSGYIHESRQITSYDLVNTGFGTLPDNEFTYQKAPWMAGQFVWAGFDYHGEPDPYEEGYFPAHSSYFGIVDMAGFKKDRFYLYQSQWTDDPMIHMLPHWNWPNRVGEITPVYVYSNAEEVELIVNGQSMGKKGLNEGEYRWKWNDVTYEPGYIQAIGYDAEGNQLVEEKIMTAGTPAKIQLQADRSTILANGEDLSFITVTVTDEAGNICPEATNQIAFSIEGSGDLAAVGNGDPTCLESYQEPQRSVFHGKALLIVKSSEEKGSISVTATSTGLEAASLSIKTD